MQVVGKNTFTVGTIGRQEPKCGTNRAHPAFIELDFTKGSNYSSSVAGGATGFLNPYGADGIFCQKHQFHKCAVFTVYGILVSVGDSLHVP